MRWKPVPRHARRGHAADPRSTIVPARRHRPAAGVREPAEDLKRYPSHRCRYRGRPQRLGFVATRRSPAGCSADVKRVGGALDLGDRISRENWIEQAQVLAKGGADLLRNPPGARRGRQRRADAGRGRAAAPHRAGLPAVPRCPRMEPAFAPTSTTAPRCGESLTSAAARRTCRPSDAPARPSHDNLQRISGIDAEVEKLLDRARRQPLLPDRALVAGRRASASTRSSAPPGASAARTGSSRHKS